MQRKSNKSHKDSKAVLTLDTHHTKKVKKQTNTLRRRTDKKERNENVV